MRNPPLAQACRGFALMMAVFMIVTLAAIGVYLLTMSTGQLEAASQDEQATRAYQAARSGIDWGAYQLLQTSPPSAFAAGCTGGAASQNLTFTAPELSGPAGSARSFRAEVACTRIGNETEATVPILIYRITVTGCNGSPTACGTSIGPTYVERQLQLTLTN